MRDQNLCRNPAGNDLSPLEDDCFVAQFDRLFPVVGDVEHRQVEFVRKNFQLLENDFAAALVLSLLVLALTLTVARTRKVHDARRLFFGSIIYLPLLWVLMIAGRV